MTTDELRALDRAQDRCRRVEAKAGAMIAEARAELARAMLAAGPGAVARHTGVTRQAVHDYIRRNLEVSPDAPRKRPSRKATA